MPAILPPASSTQHVQHAPAAMPGLSLEGEASLHALQGPGFSSADLARINRSSLEALRGDAKPARKTSEKGEKAEAAGEAAGETEKSSRWAADVLARHAGDAAALLRAENGEGRRSVIVDRLTGEASARFNAEAQERAEKLLPDGAKVESTLAWQSGRAGASIGSGSVGGGFRVFSPVPLPAALSREGRTAFVQAGLTQTNDESTRRIGHFGLGLRETGSIGETAWLIGANAFFDRDLTRGHARMSLGGEAGAGHPALGVLTLALNVYRRLSDWRTSPDFAGGGIEERPADGWDVRGRFMLPWLSSLAVTASYEHWRGEKTAPFGNAADGLLQSPSVYSAGLAFSPVEALSIGAEHRRSEAGEHENRIEASLTLPLSADAADWRRAFAWTPLRTLTADTLRASLERRFVERNYTMPLEYRAKPGHFSISSCGAQADGRSVCVRLLDAFGEPAAGIGAKVRTDSSCVTLDAPAGRYRADDSGRFFVRIDNSCASTAHLIVEAGTSSAVLPLTFSAVDWRLSAKMDEITHAETAEIRLETRALQAAASAEAGNRSGDAAEAASVALRWHVEGRGRLESAPSAVRPGEAVAARYAPDPAMTEGESADIVLEPIGSGETFRTTIRLREFGAGENAFAVAPETLEAGEKAVARFSNLRAGAAVRWTLASTEASAGRGASNTSGASLSPDGIVRAGAELETTVDETGTAFVYVIHAEPALEAETADARESRNVRVKLAAEPLIPGASARSFELLLVRGAVDAGTGGVGKLSIRAEKTTAPLHALSGAQDAVMTLSGGREGESVKWSIENVAFVSKDEAFGSCGPRGCRASAVIRGASPYEGRATVRAEALGKTLVYEMDYENYDDAVISFPTVTSESVSYEETFEAVATGVMPGSVVNWSAKGATPSASSSQADAEGRAVMQFVAVADRSLHSIEIEAQYARNASETKKAAAVIALIDWLDFVTLELSAEELWNSETGYAYLKGLKPGTPVQWTLPEEVFMREADEVANEKGEARLKFELDNDAPIAFQSAPIKATVASKDFVKTVRFSDRDWFVYLWDATELNDPDRYSYKAWAARLIGNRDYVVQFTKCRPGDVAHFDIVPNTADIQPISDNTVVCSSNRTAEWYFRSGSAKGKFSVNIRIVNTTDTVVGTVTPGACKYGDVAEATKSGQPSLSEDGCPNGTTLTVRHTCSDIEMAMEPSFHIFNVELNGYPVKRLWMNESTQITTPGNSRCYAVLKLGVVTCSSSEGRCSVTGKATVYHDGVPMGDIVTPLTYPLGPWP